MKVFARAAIFMMLSVWLIGSAQEVNEFSSISDTAESEHWNIQLFPVAENGRLIGFRVMNFEQVGPHLTEALHETDTILLPTGPLTGAEIRQFVVEDRLDELFRPIGPSADGTIRWRVRSPGGREREVSVISSPPPSVSLSLQEILRQWAIESGAVENPELRQRL